MPWECYDVIIFLLFPVYQTAVAQTLTLSEELIFCGCADGTVRALWAADLHFVCTLPRPHPLGSDVSAMTEAR